MSQEVTPEDRSTAKLILALFVAVGGVALAVYQFVQTRPFEKDRQTAQAPARATIAQSDDGRQLLWAKGPRNVEQGEWFDITDSPLDPQGYQYGIGKDSIPAIDRPKFVAINERDMLSKHGIHDQTPVLGYEHNQQAKAYPIHILNRHELVNDEVGGKPVTVGW